MATLTHKEKKLISYLKNFMKQNEDNLRRWTVDVPTKKKDNLFSIREVAKVLNKSIPKNTCLVVEISFHENKVKNQKEFMKGINELGYETQALRKFSASKNWILIH